MSLLMKATEIVTRPVVTLAGEDVAQIRDVVYDDDGVVVGFTLAGRRSADSGSADEYSDRKREGD